MKMPPNSTLQEQCKIENELKSEISKILKDKNLKFCITDDEFINEKLL